MSENTGDEVLLISCSHLPRHFERGCDTDKMMATRRTLITDSLYKGEM